MFGLWVLGIMNKKAVEIVDEDMSSVKRTEFVTAADAIRRRRIVFEPAALLVTAHQHVNPLGHQARGRASCGAPYFTVNPNGCLGH